ncbi:MAG: tetratricopeptide repeat protein [Vulcanimicrobiota bacterium]
MGKHTLKDLTVLFLILFIIAIFLDYSNAVSSIFTRNAAKTGATRNVLFTFCEQCASALFSGRNIHESSQDINVPVDPPETGALPPQGSTEWFIVKAQRFYAEKNYRDAIAYGESAIRLLSSRSAPASKLCPVHELLASACEAEDDYHAALLQYRYLTAIDSSNTSYVARAHHMEKKIDSRYISEAGKYMDDARRAFNARKYAQAFDLSQSAIELYKKAIATEANIASALAFQSDCCMELKDYNNALYKIREAIATDSTNGSFVMKMHRIPIPSNTGSAAAAVSLTGRAASSGIHSSSDVYKKMLSQYFDNPCTGPECSPSCPSQSQVYVSPACNSSLPGSTMVNAFQKSGTKPSFSQNDYLIQQLESERKATQARNECLMQQMEQNRQAAQARNELLIRSFSGSSLSSRKP